MAELKFDWSACIVSGGAELINRVEAARAEYSSVCSEYFDYLVSVSYTHLTLPTNSRV